ncbi:FAD-dependent oxidoreductase [Geminisphaera colitermitum]|uniref:FAD-dependent oxidoreductase n=1 Tax=Geminisphaera colitermitum TaxID=1148786 RepID=UPI000158D1DE|nr:FAD-dependent oxidoreductase [Geminisphaera colitermitum]
MATITEPARAIPILTDTDVVVCGGGPSGIIAATAAARTGARVVLLERHGFLGGMATAGMVGPLSKFNFDGRRIVDGIPGEFIRALHAAGGAIIDLPSGNIPYDAELYKLTAQRLVLNAGVDVILHAHVASVIEPPDTPGRVTHVFIETKEGRCAIAARMVIDCTGTGDLVARTTLPIEMRNNRANGELQPMTLYFRLGGVDTEKLTLLMARDRTKYASPELRAILQTEVAAGRLRNFGGPWAVHGSTIRPGEVSVNATRITGNAIDARDLTRAELTLREEIHAIAAAFRRQHPAFANSHLIDTAPQVGIRETRTITGLHTMTADDVLSPSDFPDTVALGGHPIDIHQSTDSQQNARFIEAPYHIPYRSLVPVGSQNVLVAGGTISATREAFGTIRVQAQCMALGQAAGTAAALCIARNQTVTTLDATHLRAHLRNDGAIVDA